jgi:hypothetical protein
MTKKGQIINGLTVSISAIIGIAILLAIGLTVLRSVATGIEENNNPLYTEASGTVTAAGNATIDIIDSLSNTSVWIGILVIVIFAGAVLYFVKQNQ